MQALSIIAHRGASYDAPENTLASIRLAWQQDADAAEIDVHLSRDGEIVVIHDHDTCRTTGFSGKVASQLLGELKELDVGAWKGNQFTGERIPTLDEVLAVLPTEKRLVIEIKSGGGAVATALQTSLDRSDVRLEQISFISFDLDLLKATKAVLPEVEVLWLHDSPREKDAAERIAQLERLIHICRQQKFDGLNINWGWPIDKRVVQHVKNAELKLYAWTVNDCDVARQLMEAGIDGITTDRPGWLREQLQ